MGIAKSGTHSIAELFRPPLRSMHEPEAARFVLTLREPRSWLDSIINQQLAHYSEAHWVKLRELRFQPQRYPHRGGEEALRQRGLYSLDGYLRYWTWHQQVVLDTVPPDRLMLVPTQEIGARAEAIAAFGAIPERFLRANRAPSYTAMKKFGVLEELDPQRLQDAIETHCRAMVDRLFPRHGGHETG